MAGFLYYIPGKTDAITRDEIVAAGLAYALGPEVRKVTVLRGPDGCQGVVVVDPQSVAGERTAYRQSEQQWRKSPHGDAWVGMYADSRPVPEILAREKQIDGHLVALLDGNPWLVPVARGWTEEDGELRWYHTLPRRSELAADGSWCPGRVVERLAPLWSVAQRWLVATVGAANEVDSDTRIVSFDFSGVHRAAVDVLKENYRIGEAEASMLGVLSKEACREILDALVDRPTMERWLKKKRQTTTTLVGSTTVDGSAATTGDTGQR
ncbi:MAG: hypothetical protein WC107_06270 [Patescibacteria group bacterium]